MKLPRRRLKQLALAFGVGLLAWMSWQASRWWRVRQIYEMQTPSDTPPMTAAHVAALRSLRFGWNTYIESGGPVVDPMAPYGSTDMAADLAPIVGTRDPVAIAHFHREVSSLLIWALEHCEVAPGAYSLAHLDNASIQNHLRRGLAGLHSTRAEAIVAERPRLEPDRSFRYTDQHRRLLRNLRFEWPASQHMWIVAGAGRPVPAVHFKRPFGDMTAFEIDMAEILGLPRPGEPPDPMFDRLYWEMWPALQVFVEHVSLDGCR